MTQVLAPTIPLVLVGLTMLVLLRRLFPWLVRVGVLLLVLWAAVSIVSVATSVRTRDDPPPDCAARAAAAATGLAATVATYRTEQTVRSARNVAATSSCLDGVFTLQVAVSGQKSPPGSVALPPDPVFDTFDATQNGNTRETDSERKLLEVIYAATTPATRGMVYLHSERTPCDSCAGVVTQFRAARPAVTVEIV